MPIPFDGKGVPTRPHSFPKELNEVASIIFDDEVGHGIGLRGVRPKRDLHISRFQFHEGLVQVLDD